MLHETDEECVLHAWESILMGLGNVPSVFGLRRVVVNALSLQEYRFRNTKCDCYSDFVTSFTWTQILRASWWRGFYIPSNVSPAGLPIRLAPSFLRLIFGFCWPLGAFINYTTYLFTYLSGLQAETCCGNSCFRPPVVTYVPQSLRRIDSSSSITVWSLLAGMLDRTCCDITVKNHLEIVCHAQRTLCNVHLFFAVSVTVKVHGYIGLTVPQTAVFNAAIINLCYTLSLLILSVN